MDQSGSAFFEQLSGSKNKIKSKNKSSGETLEGWATVKKRYMKQLVMKRN